jgi:hypothetical protein
MPPPQIPQSSEKSPPPKSPVIPENREAIYLESSVGLHQHHPPSQKPSPNQTPSPRRLCPPKLSAQKESRAHQRRSTPPTPFTRKKSPPPNPPSFQKIAKRFIWNPVCASTNPTLHHRSPAPTKLRPPGDLVRRSFQRRRKAGLTNASPHPSTPFTTKKSPTPKNSLAFFPVLV